jgi:hypothetical protein
MRPRQRQSPSAEITAFLTTAASSLRLVKAVLIVAYKGRAVLTPVHNCFSHRNDFAKTPNVLTQGSDLARGDVERLVDSSEIVVYGADRNDSRVIRSSSFGKAAVRPNYPATTTNPCTCRHSRRGLGR